MGVFLLASCTKQNEAFFKDKQGNTCDTTSISFAQSILPVFQSHCYSCHANGLNFGNVELQTYEQIKFQTAQHDLIQVINHASGFSPMPLGEPKLSDCDIAKITAWMNAGLPNN